jgi:hypothetical protein
LIGCKAPVEAKMDADAKKPHVLLNHPSYANVTANSVVQEHFTFSPELCAQNAAKVSSFAFPG